MNTIVLKIKFYVFNGECPAGMEDSLNAVLSEWNEGRYSFDVELIQHGLQACVDQAVRDCFEKQLRKKYGNEMVQTSPSSRTARAVVELEKMTLPKVYLRDTLVASLEKGSDE